MKRIVEPEWLDELPPGDPRAAGSRRDLRRLNTWMRNHTIMTNALQTAVNGHAPKQIVELGAGDGYFLLRVAQLVMGNGTAASGNAIAWHEVNVTLLDRQKVVTPQTLAAFASLGWHVEAVVADIFDWAQTPAQAEIVIVNEVLHHFDDARLAGLFRVIAGRARLFIAIEPRRAPWPLFCSRLLWAINCNSVTRHDATVSVRAGFDREELSALWSDKKHWQLTERRASWFSHLFIAQKARQAT
jgi:2-polyprenyl-3-methyl-5-hydroxy-6-metoxy-1,4-benzoquinol methylase